MSLGVVGGVSEEEDVAGRGGLPGVEGEGEEALEGVGPGFPVAELVDDGLEGDGPGGEALALAVSARASRPRASGPGGRRRSSRPGSRGCGACARGSGADLGREEGLGRDGEVAVVLLGVPGEAAVGGGAGEEAGHGAGDVEEEGPGSGGRGWRVRTGRPCPRGPRRGERSPGGPRRRSGRGRRRRRWIRCLRRSRDGACSRPRGGARSGTSTVRVAGTMPSKRVSPTKEPLTKARTWWSGSVSVSLPPWRSTESRAVSGTRTGESRVKG